MIERNGVIKLEKWKPIADFEGFYEVSDEGRVRSLERTVTVRNPQGVMAPRTYKSMFLVCHISLSGYRIVTLVRPGMKRKCFNVHRLVLETFIGPAPEGMEACHGPAGATVNRLGNLRWGTRSSNALDRHRDGTMQETRGEDFANAKLTDEAARMVRQLRGVVSQRQLADQLGVSHRTVGRVQRHEAWKHV